MVTTDLKKGLIRIEATAGYAGIRTLLCHVHGEPPLSGFGVYHSSWSRPAHLLTILSKIQEK